MIELSHIAARGEVLRDVSLVLEPGQRLVLAGANGSGKSTLLHVLMGLQATKSGTVRVDGLDPFDTKQVQEVRRRIGYVQQRPDDQIVATSVEDDVAFGPENLGLPVEELRERVDESLSRVGLTGLESREPHTLSGGQKQRLVIAGALALHPNYLVLDEPTAQLDPQGRADVLEVMRRLQEQGTGIVQVTHDREEMALADRVAVLFEGSIAFLGSFEELQEHREHFEKWGIDPGLSPIELASFSGDDRTHYTLEARDLALSYKVGTQHTAALKDASLKVSSGELIVIKGDTGSGKSTLLSILAKLAEPDAGELQVLGGRADARLVFQDPETQLFSETVRDDVAFGPRNLGASNEEARRAATEAMQQVGLAPEEFADRSPFLLSGGEARRAAIAGIVAMKPAFFLADEPTSALDAQGRDRVRALIASLTAQSAVVVVTHNPEQFSDVATRIYHIEDGVLSLESDCAEAGSLQSQSEQGADKESEQLQKPEASLTKKELRKERKEARRKKKGGLPLNFSLYVPGNSLLHRADPRTKIITAALIIIALFSYMNWLTVAGVFALVVGFALAAKIPFGPVAKMMRPLSILILFTLIVHSLSWQPFGFSIEGFARGGLFTLRLVDVMMISLLVTLTTSPVALSDGLTLLMKPLRKLKVPVDDLAIILSIALRYIPTILEEALNIVKAQTARGASFSEGNMFSRLKAWIPVIVPLLIQLFRRADTLALAMEARCYVTSSEAGSGKYPVRTRLRTLRLQRLDFLMIASAVLITLAVIVLPRVLA